MPRFDRKDRTRALLPVAFGVTAVAIVAAVAACATNPATGRSQLMLVSSNDEIQMGQQAVPGVIDEFGTYDDPSLSQWVAGIGTSLDRVTERPDLPYHYTVLDSSVVNAFALPGGPVFLTRGLIAHANDEAELASVMGHETGHVVARHSAEQASRAQLLGLGLGVAGIVKPGLQQFGNLIGAGAQLLLLRYSRDAEREADMLGVRYIARAGYDPFAMPRFMKVLDQISKDSGQALPNWLSTHPNPGERVATTTREAQSAPKTANPKTDRQALLDHVDGIVFGDDPRQGYQKGNTFHHPQLRFRFDVPSGWKTINTRQMVAAVDNKENPTAQFVLQLVPPDKAAGGNPGAFVQQLQSKNPNVQFEGTGGTLNGFPAWEGVVRIPDPQGGAQTIAAAWVSYGGNLYQMLGATAQAGSLGPVQQVMNSFRREDDPGVINVKPVLLRLANVGRGTRLSDFCASRRDLGGTCRDVAELNHLLETDTIETSVVKYPARQDPNYP